MLLINTFHVFLIYLALALLLCLPPYFKWWKKLVLFLNRVKINSERMAKIILILSPFLLILAIIIAYLYYFKKELKINFWLLFMPAGFIIIPFISSFYGIVAIIKKQKQIELGNLIFLIIIFCSFGAAAVNLHDIFWTTRRTNLYTKFAAGGEDIAPWVNFLHVGSYDYRIFGFYMAMQTIIWLFLGHIIFFRFFKINEIKRNLWPLILNWIALIFLTLAVTLIDWSDIITPPYFHTLIISIAIFISCLIFYKSGLELSKSFHHNKVV